MCRVVLAESTMSILQDRTRAVLLESGRASLDMGLEPIPFPPNTSSPWQDDFCWDDYIEFKSWLDSMLFSGRQCNRPQMEPVSAKFATAVASHYFSVTPRRYDFSDFAISATSVQVILLADQSPIRTVLLGAAGLITQVSMYFDVDGTCEVLQFIAHILRRAGDPACVSVLKIAQLCLLGSAIARTCRSEPQDFVVPQCFADITGKSRALKSLLMPTAFLSPQTHTRILELFNEFPQSDLDI